MGNSRRVQARTPLNALTSKGTNHNGSCERRLTLWSSNASASLEQDSLASNIPDEVLGAKVFDEDEITQGDQIDFDACGVPPTWDDGEGLDQATLTNTILAQFAGDDSLDHVYDQIAEETIPLSDFRTMYNHGRDAHVREHALRLLKKKVKVSISKRMQYDKDDKDIVYSDMGV